MNIIYISIGNLKKLLEIQEIICYTIGSKAIYYLLSFPCLTTN